jgi:hypothetical protein
MFERFRGNKTKGGGGPRCVYYKVQEIGGNRGRKSTPRIGKYSSKSNIIIGLLCLTPTRISTGRSQL